MGKIIGKEYDTFGTNCINLICSNVIIERDSLFNEGESIKYVSMESNRNMVSYINETHLNYFNPSMCYYLAFCRIGGFKVLIEGSVMKEGYFHGDKYNFLCLGNCTLKCGNMNNLILVSGRNYTLYSTNSIINKFHISNSLMKSICIDPAIGKK